MEKISCRIAEDIMPLYIENLLHPGSVVLLEDHLQVCDSCREKVQRMKQESFKLQETKTTYLPSVELRMGRWIKDGIRWGSYVLPGIVIAILLRGGLHYVFPDIWERVLFPLGIYAVAIHGIVFIIFSILSLMVCIFPDGNAHIIT